jgi:hypothetical protein
MQEKIEKGQGEGETGSGIRHICFHPETPDGNKYDGSIPPTKVEGICSKNPIGY